MYVINNSYIFRKDLEIYFMLKKSYIILKKKSRFFFKNTIYLFL